MYQGLVVHTGNECYFSKVSVRMRQKLTFFGSVFGCNDVYVCAQHISINSSCMYIFTVKRY